MSTNKTASAAGLMRWMWDHMDKDAASDADLEFVGDAVDRAADAARDLSEVVDATACLIMSDQDSRSTKCGALQESSDLPAYLLHIAESLRTIHGLAEIGSEANLLLQRRLKANAAVGRACAADGDAPASGKSRRLQRNKQSEREAA